MGFFDVIHDGRRGGLDPVSYFSPVGPLPAKVGVVDGVLGVGVGGGVAAGNRVGGGELAEGG